MADNSVRTAGPAPTAPASVTANTYNPNAVSDLVAGTPVRTSTVDAVGVTPAEANGVTTTACTGIAQSNSAAGHPAHVQFSGPLDLTTAEWDAITGDTGGLVPNARYYLSQSTPGKMTKTRPTTGIRAPLGVALSATTLLIQITDAATVGA